MPDVDGDQVTEVTTDTIKSRCRKRGQHARLVRIRGDVKQVVSVEEIRWNGNDRRWFSNDGPMAKSTSPIPTPSARSRRSAGSTRPPGPSRPVPGFSVPIEPVPGRTPPEPVESPRPVGRRPAIVAATRPQRQRGPWANGQPAASAQAVFSAHSPNATINPWLSASGMKPASGTRRDLDGPSAIRRLEPGQQVRGTSPHGR